jgi:L-iditol 2-dehydrogenase
MHGAGDVRLHDEPVPDVPPRDELVRVTAVGVCGSDLHWYAEGGIGDARLDRRPLVLGHEMAGVIAGGARDGERVAIDPALPCHRCTQCRTGDMNLCPTIRFAGHGEVDGGLREYIAWPGDRLHALPDQLSDSDGAMLEPLGVALHALDLAHLRVGMHVVVLGCGPIGLLLIQVLRVAGAATVTAVDPVGLRRAAAHRLGADQVTAEVGPDAPGEGFDLAFEATNSGQAAQTAMEAVRPGARVVLAGIPDNDEIAFRASDARRKGLTLVLSRRMKETYPRATRLVASGRVDVAAVVTDHFDLDRIDEAFATAATRECLKVVVHPTV